MPDKHEEIPKRKQSKLSERAKNTKHKNISRRDSSSSEYKADKDIKMR